MNSLIFIKNKLSTYFKLKFIYPIKYKKVGRLSSIVPPKFLQSKGLIIEENVIIQDWVMLKEIGNYNFIGKNTYVENCSSIGSFCSISFDVKIGLRNHHLKTISTSPYFYRKSKGWVKKDNSPIKDPVVIGHDVLISANSIVLDGVSIGTGAVVASGAIVNKNVPPYAIVGGVPAKVLKYRFDKETINNLLESKWWLNDEDILKELWQYFDNPNEFLKKINE